MGETRRGFLRQLGLLPLGVAAAELGIAATLPVYGRSPVELFAAGLRCGVTAPTRPWFRLTPHDPTPMKLAWCHDVERSLTDHIKRHGLISTKKVIYAHPRAMDEIRKGLDQHRYGIGQFTSTRPL